MVPQATCTAARRCWLRAWERAVSEKLIPYRNQDGTWTVKGYTVSPVGPGWSDLSCTCAGNRYPSCKHRAVVAKAIAAHVRPVRGTAKVVAPSTPAEVAHKALPKAAVLAELAGVGR